MMAQLNQLILQVSNTTPFRSNVDSHLIRAAMVFEFFAFSIQKWNQYTVEMLVPMISHSPVVFWLLPVFGLRGTGYFLATTETIFGALVFLGYWSPRLGILGALGSIVTYIGTTTIMPFLPGAWAQEAGGFPNLHVADGIPDEGRSVPRCFILFAQAGSGACLAGDKAKFDPVVGRKYENIEISVHRYTRISRQVGLDRERLTMLPRSAALSSVCFGQACGRSDPN